MSPSISPSISPSVSPSPSPGWTDYTKGDENVLPTDDANLETNYTGTDVTNVATKNDVRVGQTATAEYTIHQYKDYVGAGNAIGLECELQSNTAGSYSTIYLQAYNQNTPAWETIASNNIIAADTDFTLSGNIANTTNYVDASGVISCRVYQEAV